MLSALLGALQLLLPFSLAAHQQPLHSLGRTCFWVVERRARSNLRGLLTENGGGKKNKVKSRKI